MELRIYFTVLLLWMTTEIVICLDSTDFENHETEVGGEYRRSVADDTKIKAPWQVCVNFLGKDSLIPQKCYCGGVLVSPKWVISSAHCFRSNDASSSWRKSQFQFVLGMSTGSKRQMFRAKNIILHDGYRPSKKTYVPGGNDIALIELDQNAKTDAQNVKVLQLPNSNTNFDGMECLIGDWDGTDFENHEPEIGGEYRRSVTDDTEIKAPWQVCVNFLGKDSLIPQKCYCGGVLVSPKWVISSAHCFRSNDTSSSWRKSQFQLVLGMSTGSKRQMFRAKNIILHDGYRPSKKPCVPGENDIALIELDQNAKTDAQNVKVLQLPNSNTNFDGMECLIGDWDGRTGTDVSYETVSIPTDPHVCQINNNTRKSKVLEGGSGGAIACGQENKILAGVVQNGKRCGQSGTYLEITEYLNWIGQNTGLFSSNRGHTRKKRMLGTSSCYTPSNDEDFAKLLEASNGFMDDCFGNGLEPEIIDNLPDDEKERITEFVSKFSDEKNARRIIYNTQNFGDVLNLIYHLGKGGLQTMKGILENHIIIRQFRGEEIINGFLVTKGNFYCFPYMVNGQLIQVRDLSDGSYGEIINRIGKSNFGPGDQLPCFAGFRDYYGDKSVHLAHFTFANLFAESVRNWNSLTIGVAVIKTKFTSTIKMFRENIWPMIGGSWKNHATWGKDTENTPLATKDKFNELVELLGAKKYNVTRLRRGMIRVFCKLYDEMEESRPTCCTDE